MSDTNPYRIFFKDSQTGQRFVDSLKDLIDQQHQLAEKNPELSRDHTQRAKGIREVLHIIESLSAVTKKGPTFVN